MDEIHGKLMLVRVSEGSSYRDSTVEKVFGGRSKGLQGWKWIATDFWTGCPEIKAAVLMKF